MTPENQAATQIDFYSRLWRQNGVGPKSLAMNSSQSQELRFKALLKNLVPYAGEGSTLHDVGAGFCDLKRYIDANHPGLFAYSATELLPAFAEQAQALHPGVNVSQRDFLETPDNNSFDFLILSGTLNVKSSSSRVDPMLQATSLLEAMFKRCRVGIAFNFVSAYRTFSDETVAYLDPKDLIDFVYSRLSRFFVLDTATPLFEPVMTVFHPSLVTSMHPEPEFSRYFDAPSRLSAQ